MTRTRAGTPVCVYVYVRRLNENAVFLPLARVSPHFRSYLSTSGPCLSTLCRRNMERHRCDEPVRACVHPPAEDGRIGARGTIGGGEGERAGGGGGWRREGGETERAMVREESSNGDFTDFHGGNASRSERCGRCVQVELTRHRISSFPPRKKARDPLLYSTILLSLVVLLLLLLLLLLAKHNNG